MIKHINLWRHFWNSLVNHHGKGKIQKGGELKLDPSTKIRYLANVLCSGPSNFNKNRYCHNLPVNLHLDRWIHYCMYCSWLVFTNCILYQESNCSCLYNQTRHSFIHLLIWWNLFVSSRCSPRMFSQLECESFKQIILKQTSKCNTREHWNKIYYSLISLQLETTWTPYKGGDI